MLERLSGIVDTEEPRFQSLKAENHKAWEQSVQNVCKGMTAAVDEYYAKEMSLYLEMQQ